MLKKTKKSLAAAAFAFFASAGTLSAYELNYSDANANDSANSDLLVENSSEGTTPISLAVKGFYAFANEDILDGSGISIDLMGVGVELGVTPVVSPNFKLDVVFGMNFGIGFEEDEYHSRYYRYDEEYTLWSYSLLTGVNLRFGNDDVSFYVGPRIGMHYLNFEVEDNYYGDDESDSDVGAMFGLELGLDINFNRHNALTIGGSYLQSTAQPFDIMEEQSYFTVSIGYKYTF